MIRMPKPDSFSLRYTGCPNVPVPPITSIVFFTIRSSSDLYRCNFLSLIHFFHFMPQCSLEFRVLEAVSCSQQFGRLDSPAGQNEFLAHLTHHHAYHECGHDTARFLSQSLG